MTPGHEREVRKLVSVVFSDVAGSTALAEQLDPESLRRAMTRYFEAARPAHERHGGVVEKFIGDAVVAVFGVPGTHEDDALRAVLAANELRDAMVELNRELEWELRTTLPIRIGVNTGLVLAGDERQGHAFVSGDTVTVAARLEQAAGAGEVLLGEATYRLVADAVQARPMAPFVPRGRSAPVAAYRLLAVTPGAPGLSRRLDTPLVGRAGELAVLHQVLERAISRQACELVSVLGDAGVGKSRLLRAFADQTGEQVVLLHARCRAGGEATTAPILDELLAQATAAAAGGASCPVDAAELAADPSSVFWTVRQLLMELAIARPVVVIIDDLHWAEPAMLDLVEYLHAFARWAPLLLVTAARPQQLQFRHRQTVGTAGARLALGPLGAAEAAELAIWLHGPGGLDSATAAHIAAWAEGNPLFIEELLRPDAGTPDWAGGALGAPGRLEERRLPLAVEALLEAELDCLTAEERLVLELASLVGRTFTWASVAALAPARLRPRVGAVLLGLARRNLIRVADRGPSDDAFAFRHGLLRDVAYQAIPMRRRAVLHMRVAELAGRSTFEAGEAVGQGVLPARLRR